MTLAQNFMVSRVQSLFIQSPEKEYLPPIPFPERVAKNKKIG